jgi:pimeloyl-ACP methyl ester carboxylesterase
MSYSNSLNAGEITNEQMILDIIAVSNYLRERFDKDKIYLLAHSGGTFYGIQAASRSPELYHAYIGMAQMANTRESEIAAYNYMRSYYLEQNNKPMVKKIDKYKVSGTDEEFFEYMTSMLRDNTMHKLGIGTARRMNSVFKGIFLPVMNCKAYTIKEKLNIWKGKTFLRTQTGLVRDVAEINISEMITSLELPVFFMSGIYDYTVNYSITKNYYETLQATQKGFYSFENSAHSPLWEEPEKFIAIMNTDVIKAEFNLAD